MHLPVLLEETLQHLIVESSGVYVDCTLGYGGHAEGILKDTNSLLIGIEQDIKALEYAEKRLKPYEGRVIFRHDNFRRLEKILLELGVTKVEGILFDLGVSSGQLEESQRGFSYHLEGDLDMRMDEFGLLNAWTIVNEWPEKELEKIILEYGEERYAKFIARGIAKARLEKTIDTTSELVEVIKASVPISYRKEKHPARRTFQALRMAVNDELGALEEALPQAVNCLKKGGRLCVITFHSLEDRLVKTFFKKESSSCICPPSQPICTCHHKPSLKVITKKPITPKNEEVARNRRARSAKLRVAEKLEV